ncbi:MAG: hypothetical protein ACRDWI_17860 [Jiangellaceae bacterium]
MSGRTSSRRGRRCASGTTEFDYRDVFYAEALGSLDVPATVFSLDNGESAAVDGTITADSAPAEGRTLLGEMEVVTDEDAVVGRGSVTVGAVE